MLSNWVLEKLEAQKDASMLLVRDSLRLLPEADGAVHRFANDNGFTVVIASTNLVFRELFEKASMSKDAKKILLIDRAPVRRRSHSSLAKAPPPFYPDFLSKVPETARIDVNLRQYLIEKTGDPNWPQETNEPRFARLISSCLENVLKAHSNLRAAHPTRFTDHDFKAIVAYSALGIPEAAFKLKWAEAKSYWRIGLLGHHALEELDSLVPEVARPIREELRGAPSPFCWFADHPAEIVVRSFYLAAILAQHFEHWQLLLTNIDPELKPFSKIEPAFLRKAAPELVSLDPARAHEDLLEIEASLSKDALTFLLLDQMKIAERDRFAAAIKNESYSILIRSLALLMALAELVSEPPDRKALEEVMRSLLSEGDRKTATFIEGRPSTAWTNLKEAYIRAWEIMRIKNDLALAVKNLKVRKVEDLSFKWFRSVWNEKRANRLEYYLSALERLAHSVDFLPRSATDLPSAFVNAADRIRERIGVMREDIQRLLLELNGRYQDLVASEYTSWIGKDGKVRLTAQFLRRCVKPNWDPKNEKAVVFVFDGMRYDIWDELLRPIFEDRMELIADYPASSLLPSETHISRKAIFAGAYPDAFDLRSGEDALLKDAMRREFGYEGDVEIVVPDGMGTGETVRYRAGNIDFYIFELCDKELHKVQMKTLPDGRVVPGRPLAFIYQQHIKNIIDTEVLAIVRDLPHDTKVFIVADHGFGPVGRERIRLETTWLNDPTDCFYQNAWLREKLSDVSAPRKVRANTLEFSIAELHMPAVQEAYDRSTNRHWQKKYASIIFPRTGYALARPRSHFNPDAYSHGGISVQEMLIPMIVMRVKSAEEGLIILGTIVGPTDVIEGEEAEFRLPIELTQPRKVQDLRIEARATYRNKEDAAPLPPQVQYVSGKGGDVVFRFTPDPGDASEEERRTGIMERTLRISVTYREGPRTVRKSRTLRFSVRLSPAKIVRRVPAHLGKILGLTPKSMR